MQMPKQVPLIEQRTLVRLKPDARKDDRIVVTDAHDALIVIVIASSEAPVASADKPIAALREALRATSGCGVACIKPLVAAGVHLRLGKPLTRHGCERTWA